MTTYSRLFLAASVAALTAGAAVAQTASSEVEDRNEALTEEIQEEFERDTTFGNEGRALGFTGSMALRGNVTSGNTDTATLGVGADMGYYDGTNGYDLSFSYTYSENEGTVDENELLYDAQYTRDFNPDFYGFVRLQGQIQTLDLAEFRTSDNFLGFGVGYRVVNTPTTQWSIQAGPGYRVVELESLEDFDEGALSVSSAYYNKLSDGLAVTVDTDVIASESDTVVYNDLGLNVSMTQDLALRTSLVTEYHTDPEPGRDDTDNTFGVSLVYSFN